MDVVCGLTAFMVTQKNNKINENDKQKIQKVKKENYNKTRKLSWRTANRNPYALGQEEIMVFSRNYTGHRIS